VINHFNKKWRTHAKRKEYLTTFSSSSWGQLSLGQQAEHSLSSCSACAKKYGELQLAYPGLPYYSAPSTLVQLPQEGESVKGVTRMVLGELNQSYHEAFGQGFTEAAVRYCGKAEGIEKRKSCLEKRKATREIQKKCRDSANQQYASTATLSYLSQNESMRSYQRKRLAQSFERLPERKRTKSHVVSQTKLTTYDTEAILAEVQEWPEGKRMNWMKLHEDTTFAEGMLVRL